MRRVFKEFLGDYDEFIEGARLFFKKVLRIRRRKFD